MSYSEMTTHSFFHKKRIHKSLLVPLLANSQTDSSTQKTMLSSPPHETIPDTSTLLGSQLRTICIPTSVPHFTQMERPNSDLLYPLSSGGILPISLANVLHPQGHRSTTSPVSQSTVCRHSCIHRINRCASRIWGPSLRTNPSTKSHLCIRSFSNRHRFNSV